MERQVFPRRVRPFQLVAIAVVLAPYLARAQTPGLTVRGDRVDVARDAVESQPTFATSVDARTRGPVVESVADLLDEAPGVEARRTGDGLSPTTVTMRGAPGTHVTVALDGTVLNDAEGEAVDLSLIAPALLERVDVYRGIAPLRLGMGGLGGAIELITRAPSAQPTAWVTAGYGSFESRRSALVASARAGRVSTLLGLSYRGTGGDFIFYDDLGAPMSGVAQTASRVNNDGDAFGVLYRVCVASRGSSCLLLTSDFRRRGIPGPGFEQLATPRLEQERVLLRGSHRIAWQNGWVEPFATVMARRDHFTDSGGVVMPGVALDSETNATAEETGALAAARMGDVRLEPIVRLRAEQFSTFGSDVAVDRTSRVSALGGAEARLLRDAWEITSGVACEAIADQGSMQTAPRALVSPRLGVRWHTGPLELRANLAHLERAPTLLELYGLAGFVVPNPTLVPERTDAADAGAVLHMRARDLSLRLEADGYARHARDLIVYLQRGPVGLKAFNLDAAQIAGAEALVRFAWSNHVALVASYAYTSAVTIEPTAPANGRRPPGIPEHDAYVRLEGRLGPVSAWVETSYVSGVYFDEINANAAPPRVLVDASATLAVPYVRGLSATLLVTNLLDERVGTSIVQPGDHAVTQPIEDFQGYPLPGRAFYAALTYSLESAR